MTIDPFREVRDAVRPSAAAGQLTDTTVYKIAMRHRVAEVDVRRIYTEEHARLHPETAEPDTTVGASAPPAVTEDEPTPPADTIERCGSGLAAELAADAGIAPLTLEEQAHASDMALVSDAVLALTMLGEHCPDPVWPLLAAAQSAVKDLHVALRDHHRTADLVAELAIVEARASEIRQALGEAGGFDADPLDTLDQAAENLPSPEPPGGAGGPPRSPCPDCGKEFYTAGIPRHRAACKKTRGAA